MTPATLRLREDALRIARAAISAADPAESIKRTVRLSADDLQIGNWTRNLTTILRIVVVGAGKASVRMAAAMEDVLGDRVTAGIVVTKYGHSEPLRRVRVREAGHPVPDRAGVDATGEIIRMVDGTAHDDLVVVLLSGGGSSLLIAPAEGVTLADKQATTSALLSCGATIHEINCLRKHLSRIKGGQLARACGESGVVSLVLSDVIGDPLDVIASGPTVPDPSTFGDALQIVQKYGIRGALPDSVLTHLEAGARGEQAETPKPADGIFANTHTELIGTNAIALKEAATTAENLGFSARVLTSTLRGEAGEAAKAVCALAEGLPSGAGRVALILGGETTVTLSADAGTGGRNQEFALSIAREIAGRQGIAAISVGTDGTDGPTDAAGAVVDGTTWQRAMQKGFSPADALRRHDAYPLLKATGDLVITGPTGTNVMDVVVVLVDAGTPPVSTGNT